MNLYLILCAIWIGACLLGFWPLMFQGNEYVNNPFRIIVPARPATGLTGWQSAYAEEQGEWLFSTLIGCLAFLPAAMKWGHAPYAAVAIFAVSICVRAFLPNLTLWYRLIEYVGKACRVARGPESIQTAAAQMLIDPRNGTMTQAQSETGVARAMPFARALVALLRLNLKRRG